MSSNYNFYSKNQDYHTNYCTFQNEATHTPNYLMPQTCAFAQQANYAAADKEYIYTWEEKIKKRPPAMHSKPSTKIHIIVVQSQLRSIVKAIEELKQMELYLQENVNKLSEDQWSKKMNDVHRTRALIDEAMTGIDDYFLDTFKKVLAKRTAKRMRSKRLKVERKREKMQILQLREELSRKIDENLRKMKNDIHKAKQEEENKLQMDIILREVHQKKSDAKKCIAKLDALMKLRKARENTMKGRGLKINEIEATKFKESIEQLKLMWQQKLTLYEQEETEMRVKLKQDSGDQQEMNKNCEQNIVHNLEKWNKILFGDSKTIPQRDFGGDLAKFIAVRAQWDQFISEEGTPLPVGWVTPSI